MKELAEPQGVHEKSGKKTRNGTFVHTLSRRTGTGKMVKNKPCLINEIEIMGLY